MTTDHPQSKGERTRAEIMLAAHTLFLEKGYNGTSIRQIAQRAGIALGGIYNHFGSKEEIFAAVFTERHPYLEILPLINAAQGSTVESMIQDLAKHITTVLEARPDFLNLMFIEIVEFKGEHLSSLVERVLPMMSHFAERLDEAQRRGEVRSIPLLALIRIFLGLFVSYAVTAQFAVNLPTEFSDNALKDFVDIFLHGVLLQPQTDTDTPPHSNNA
ncbi:MAG: TetR/AcrR family transcriptional regulator [Chloroflexi bacterium]|nr:TetR/AcrR family transcriptional regulator [Chloroflexota bacterium]